MNFNITPAGGNVLSVDKNVVFVVIGLNAVTSLSGCTASLIIAITIMRSKTLRTAMNFTLVNLALADIFVSVINNTIRLILYSGVASSALCHADLFVQTLCDCLKPAMLAATSFERYQSIAKPFENRGKKSRTLITVIMSWIFALGVGILSVILTIDGATLYPCRMETILIARSLTNFRELLITLPVGIVCLLLVIAFYYMMIKTLNEHSKTMAKKPKAFRNKIQPAGTNKQTLVNGPIKNGSLENKTNLKVPTNSDKVWKNEQYTVTDKEEKHDTPSKGPNTNKTGAGTSSKNTIHTDNSIVPSTENLPNIVELVSVVSTVPKRFTVRETRKSILTAMREQKLIGNKSSYASSAPASSQQNIDISIATKAKQRHSCDSPVVGTTENKGIDTSKHINGNETTLSKDHGDSSEPSAFKLLALNLRQHRPGLNLKQESQGSEILPSNISESNNETNRLEYSKNVPIKDNQQTEIKYSKTVGISIHIEKGNSQNENKGFNSLDVPPSDMKDVNEYQNNVENICMTQSSYVVTKQDLRSITREGAGKEDNEELGRNLQKTEQPNDTTTMQHFDTQLSNNHLHDNNHKIATSTCNIRKNSNCSVDGQEVVSFGNYSNKTKQSVTILKTGETVDNKQFKTVVANNTHGIKVEDADITATKSNNVVVVKVANEIKENSANVISKETIDVAVVNRANETKESTSISASTKPNDSVVVSATNETKEDGIVKIVRKPRNSHQIDVVDMDGTVHKRVEVQGAVTGAVCVLNNSNKVQGRRKVEMRAAKRIAVLIGSFVLLWLPLPLSVIFVVCQEQITQSTVEMLMIMGSISTMTTAANPLLNLLLNKQIRSAARNTLKKGFNVLRKR